MSMAKRILSVAVHPTLAKTRSLLIRSLGSDVKTVYSLTELREACQGHRYDLLLISQGISINEKTRIVTEFRQSCEGTPVLEIFDISPDLPDAEFKFHAAYGPEALVAQLKIILTKDPKGDRRDVLLFPGNMGTDGTLFPVVGFTSKEKNVPSVPRFSCRRFSA